MCLIYLDINVEDNKRDDVPVYGREFVNKWNWNTSWAKSDEVALMLNFAEQSKERVNI